MPTSPDPNDHWGAHASTYDRVYAPLTGYIAANLLASLQARVPEHARMLDIACGSGALLLAALPDIQRRRQAGGRDEIVASDFSAGMVALAERHAQRRFEAGAFSCEVQDGQALRDADASFDVACSCFGIFLFEDRHAGWREAARVLRPGGLCLRSGSTK